MTISGDFEKNFNNCPIRLEKPEIFTQDDRIHVKSKILKQRHRSAVSVLDTVHCSDVKGHEYLCDCHGIVTMPDKGNGLIDIELPCERSVSYIQNCTIAIRVMSQEIPGNHSCMAYEAYYEVVRKGISSKTIEIRLAGVKNSECTAEDLEKCRKEIDEFLYPLKPPIPPNPPIPPIPPNPTRLNSVIEKYVSALDSERDYLKKHGGHQHPVSNGKRISAKGSTTTYEFELESELFLSDDAPVAMQVGMQKASGNVISCEGFKIVITVEHDFGEVVNHAYLSVEPWQLLSALKTQLEKITAHDVIAERLINMYPTLAETSGSKEILKGQDVAKQTVEENDITVIWGPPGTGKTHTMAEIALEAVNKHKSVLIVSHSNVSVDGIVKKMIELKAKHPEYSICEGDILRYGFVRDKELDGNPVYVAYNYVLTNNRYLKREMDIAIRERDRLQKEKLYHTILGENIEKELKKLREKVRELEKGYAKDAKCLATTISKVTVDPLFEEQKYDIVMFDEVSMAYIPHIFAAALHARSKLVLVGDFRQLAPIVQSSENSILNKDIFSFLNISDGGKTNYSPTLVILDEQRRMHPGISAFSNKYVYDNRLRDYKDVFEDDGIISLEPFEGKSIGMINLSGTYCAAMKNKDNSRFNIVSAIISLQTAMKVVTGGCKSVGIITPYAAQARLIRSLIHDCIQDKDIKIRCSTVHQFQGSECDVIIFDAVESFPEAKVGWLLSKSNDSV